SAPGKKSLRLLTLTVLSARARYGSSGIATPLVAQVAVKMGWLKIMSGAMPPASDVRALASRSENGITVSLTVMPVFSLTSAHSLSQVSCGPHLWSHNSIVVDCRSGTYAGARVGLASAVPPSP